MNNIIYNGEHGLYFKATNGEFMKVYFKDLSDLKENFVRHFKIKLHAYDTQLYIIFCKDKKIDLSLMPTIISSCQNKAYSNDDFCIFALKNDNIICITDEDIQRINECIYLCEIESGFDDLQKEKSWVFECYESFGDLDAIALNNYDFIIYRPFLIRGKDLKE